jgi:hypothetical protein
MWSRAIAIGGGGAALTAAAVWGLGAFDPVVTHALMVAAIGFIYVGFALADGRPGVGVIESGVALVFFWLAAGAITTWAPLAGLALVLHGLWDLLHHPRAVSTKLPGWYPSMCAVYDWVLAAIFFVCWSRLPAT